MRLLVLGGTAFLSREVAAAAVRAGHDVTCSARGTSGPAPAGAAMIRWDRSSEPIPPELSDGAFDAVIDVARIPSWVRDAVAAIPAAHWVFVSTVSVYADAASPGGGPSNLPLLPALYDDVALDASPEAYGAMKVACEEIVRGACPGAALVRPGLIVGPGDPTGRFSYWPARLAATDDGDPVLAPGTPKARVQVIDVRDLAAWLVLLAERRTAGTFDAIAPALPMAEFMERMAGGLGARPRWVWAPDDFLLARSVQPWAGERSLPLWLPRPDYDGMLDHDAGPAAEGGLRIRPLDETAGDTAEWLRTAADAAAIGMTRDEERALLRELTVE